MRLLKRTLEKSFQKLAIKTEGLENNLKKNLDHPESEYSLHVASQCMSNLSPWSEDTKDKMLKALGIMCENWARFLD